MKITHLALCGPVTDGYSYQDNLLPKYHKKLGLEVSMITSKYIWDSNGESAIENRNQYINEYGIKTIRLGMKKKSTINSRFKRYNNLLKTLDQENPDVLFIHGVQFLDISIVVKYLKKNNIVVFVDNHADFSNSATNWLSKSILHKIIWRRYAQLIEPYVKKFYGVLPARVDFLVDMYKLPKNKVELLVMGADDEKVEETIKTNSREKIRRKYNIAENDFLVMTGGKIDNAKRQTLMLMEAINDIQEENVKLIVFGSVIPELKEEVKRLSDNKKNMFIGWLNSEDTYEYFSAADLIVFPGRHSVFWEQVAGQGIPMLVKYWDGTHHVDIGGNVGFLNEDSVSEIKSAILELYQDKAKYDEMYSKANQEGKNTFLYSRISQKSLE